MLMLSCNALCKHVNILMKKMQTPNFFVAIFKEKTIKNTKLQTLLKFRIFKHSTNLILSFNKLQTLMYFYNFSFISCPFYTHIFVIGRLHVFLPSTPNFFLHTQRNLSTSCNFIQKMGVTENSLLLTPIFSVCF